MQEVVGGKSSLSVITSALQKTGACRSEPLYEGVLMRRDGCDVLALSRNVKSAARQYKVYTLARLLAQFHHCDRGLLFGGVPLGNAHFFSPRRVQDFNARMHIPDMKGRRAVGGTGVWRQALGVGNLRAYLRSPISRTDWTEYARRDLISRTFCIFQACRQGNARRSTAIASRAASIAQSGALISVLFSGCRLDKGADFGSRRIQKVAQLRGPRSGIAPATIFAHSSITTDIAAMGSSTSISQPFSTWQFDALWFFRVHHRATISPADRLCYRLYDCIFSARS